MAPEGTPQEPGSGSTLRGFFSLPSELRNEIYGLLLVTDQIPSAFVPHSGAIRPLESWSFRRRTGGLSLGLLRVNKALHREGSSVFYGRNHFDVSGYSSKPAEKLSSWLQQIGSTNALHVQHLLIEFPGWASFQPGNPFRLDDESVAIIATIKSSCTSLKTITTTLRSTNQMELCLDGLENRKLATERLGLVDATLRSIPSLQQVGLEVYEDGPSSYIRQDMETLGWTLQKFKNEEEAEDDYWEQDNYRLSDSDDDWDEPDENEYDDYDIDNDSDFWRRAAD